MNEQYLSSAVSHTKSHRERWPTHATEPGPGGPSDETFRNEDRVLPPPPPRPPPPPPLASTAVVAPPRSLAAISSLSNLILRCRGGARSRGLLRCAEALLTLPLTPCRLPPPCVPDPSSLPRRNSSMCSESLRVCLVNASEFDDARAIILRGEAC